MGKEASLWKYVREGMKPYWKAKRVENPIGAGTPDVYYTLLTPPGVMGWIELKHAHGWPARETTPLKIKHFTPVQRNFLRIHGGAGANVRILLQVGSDYFLIGWRDALRIGEWTKSDFFDRFLHWPNRLDFPELVKFLADPPK